MARYRIHWLADGQMDSFRDKPPRNGAEPVRIKHYETGGEIEAVSVYDAWLRLQGDAPQSEGRRPFGVGDILETPEGEAVICRYWGFEAAIWVDLEKVEASQEALQALS